jgi:hypothetical protein
MEFENQPRLLSRSRSGGDRTMGVITHQDKAAPQGFFRTLTKNFSQ